MHPQALFELVARSGDPLAALDSHRGQITRAFVEGLNATTLESAQRGEFAPALMGNDWAIRAVRHLGDRELEAHTLFNRGQFAAAAGRLDEAERAYRDASELYEAHGSPEDLLDCEAERVGTLYSLGNEEEMKRVAGRALERLFGSAGDRSAAVGRGLVEMGRSLRRAGERRLARECFDALIQLAEQTGDAEYEAEACGQLAEIAAEEEAYDEAEALYRRALAIDPAPGAVAARAADLGNLAFVTYRRGDLEEAARLYAECLSLRDREGIPEGVDLDLRNAYHVLHYLGRREEALELFRRWSGGAPTIPAAVAARPIGYPLALDERGRSLGVPGYSGPVGGDAVGDA